MANNPESSSVSSAPTEGSSVEGTSTSSAPTEEAPAPKKDDKNKKKPPEPDQKPDDKKGNKDDKGQGLGMLAALLVLLEMIKAFQKIMSEKLGMDDKIKSSFKKAVDNAKKPKEKEFEAETDEQKAAHKDAAEKAQKDNDTKDELARVDEEAEPSDKDPYDFSQHMQDNPTPAPEGRDASAEARNPNMEGPEMGAPHDPETAQPGMDDDLRQDLDASAEKTAAIGSSNNNDDAPDVDVAPESSAPS